jgi:hypothetical protein
LFSKATSVPGSRQTATLGASTAEKPRVVVFGAGLARLRSLATVVVSVPRGGCDLVELRRERPIGGIGELSEKAPASSAISSAPVLSMATHKPVDQVRLADPSEQWPDGYVKIGDKVENVEATIAMMPGRQMWDEYQPSDGELILEHVPVEDWEKRAEAILHALEKAINDKIQKRYSSKMWLVVYLNIGSWGIRQAEIECSIAEIKQRYEASFDGLFVLWNDKLL